MSEAKSCLSRLSLQKCFLFVLLVVVAVVFLELTASRFGWSGIVYSAGLQAMLPLTGEADSWVLGDRQLRVLQALRVPLHDKWLVLEVSSAACASSLALPQGWGVVLTGEGRGSVRCNPPHCLSLPPKTTDAQSAAMLKNLAYLAAIKGGADVILEADCMKSLADAVSTLAFSAGREHGVMYNETLLFNPYAHFGAWAGRPRAVVGERMATNNSRLYYVRDFHRVLVKHGLSDRSHDMLPAAHNSTEPSRAAGMRFHPSTPPVFVGQGSYSPAVPSCAMYHQKALWALLAPCVSRGPRCQLLRHFLQQRLLRELDAFVGLYQMDGGSLKKNNQKISQASGPGDSAGKTGESINAKVLAEVLNAWQCNHTHSFFRCFKDLAAYLHKQGVIDSSEHSLMRWWVSALRRLEAVEPAMVNTPWRGTRKTSEVRVLLGDFQARWEAGGASWQQYLKQRLVQPLENHCNKTGLFKFSSWPKPALTDVALVVVFNSYKYFWSNLPTIEALNRPFFRHIFYCLPDVQPLLDPKNPHQRAVGQGLSFVEGFSHSWYLFYECVAAVVQMRLPGVRGYLHMGDDTLLNTWHIFHLPRDLVYSPPGGRMTSVEEPRFKGWKWWSSSLGRGPWLRAMSDLEQRSGLSDAEILGLRRDWAKVSRLSDSQQKMLDPAQYRNGTLLRNVTTFTTTLLKTKTLRSPYNTLLAGAQDWPYPSQEQAKRFVRNYYQSNAMAGLVRGQTFDFFYIPHKMADDYVTISRCFMKHGVMDELAMPAILHGIAGKEEILYINSSDLWGSNRHSPFTHYKKNNLFLHPLKLKSIWKRGSVAKSFCENHIQVLFSELAKYRKSRKSS